MLTDPIADFLTRIRNAQRARLGSVMTFHSGTNERIAKILKQEGFITDYAVKTDEQQKMKKQIDITLRYSSTMTPVIQGIKRMSTPGRRKYANREELEKNLKTFQTTIVSTSKGVLTDREAVEANVGGELLCQVS
ncbi:MAG: 30S ribosomal protein S8 [Bdellovibrionota bacterium]|nr:30S ribosomal protein S8 [Deltaproteobacteria bacterium]